MIKPNKIFMLEAIRQAKIAHKEGDYAVGAVLVKGNRIVSTGSNRSKRDESPIAHAETLAIIKASKIYKKRHLTDCVLYCTHEPCPMCSSVIVWARLKGIVYGARYEDMKKYRIKYSNKKYLWRTIDISCKEIIDKSTEKVEIVKDFLRKECIELFHNSSL
jgi:tRNA(adenine34) deaminase